MIRLTWKAGSELLEEKGPIVAIVSFMTFMSWMLFWPHGMSVSSAIGQEPENGQPVCRSENDAGALPTPLEASEKIVGRLLARWRMEGA